MAMPEIDRDFAAQMQGFRLTTAEVLYYMPDHPSLLQSFLWQTQDLAPKYPRLLRFLDYWRQEIIAVIHTVRVAHSGRIRPAEWRAVDIELRLG
tara:strand:+ start:31928 stop:32209 length:282 start_codon:yes stop_codon:yes gene_type:complete